MKKVLVGVAALCAAGVLAGGVAANPDAGQVIDSGFPCGLLDGNGNTFITTNSSITLYQGKVVLKCNGDGAGAPQLTYFNFDNTGLSCNISGYGTTNNWSDKVGYNGNSQLVCTIVFGDRRGDAASGGGAGLG